MVGAMEPLSRTAKIAIVGGLGLSALRLLRRRRVDPAHAPGKRHRGPAPRGAGATSPIIEPRHDQPWIRRSHSDSQQRRFRR